MATTDARHEFSIEHLDGAPSAAETQRLVQVINDQRPFYTLRSKKPKLYRALSGVSFQNSIGSASTGQAARSMPWNDEMNSHRRLERQLTPVPPMAPPTSPPPPPPHETASTTATVCVTFVNRSATPFHSRTWIDADEPDNGAGGGYSLPFLDDRREPVYDVPYRSDAEDAADEELDADEDLAPFSDEAASDSEFSCLDLSIFEPSLDADQPPLAAGGGSSGAGFIYRPPRPPRDNRNGADLNGLLRRGKSLRDKLKRPLRRLLKTPPEPPRVDYFRPEATELCESRQSTPIIEPPRTVVLYRELNEEATGGLFGGDFDAPTDHRDADQVDAAINAAGKTNKFGSVEPLAGGGKIFRFEFPVRNSGRCARHIFVFH